MRLFNKTKKERPKRGKSGYEDINEVDTGASQAAKVATNDAHVRRVRGLDGGNNLSTSSNLRHSQPQRTHNSQPSQRHSNRRDSFADESHSEDLHGSQPRHSSGGSRAEPPIEGPTDYRGRDAAAREPLNLIPEIDSDSKNPSYGMNELEDSSARSKDHRSGNIWSPPPLPDRANHAESKINSTQQSDLLDRITAIIREANRRRPLLKETESRLQSGMIDTALELLLDYWAGEDDTVYHHLETAAKDSSIDMQVFDSKYRKGGNCSIVPLLTDRLREAETEETKIRRLTTTINKSTAELKLPFDGREELPTMIDVMLERLRADALLKQNMRSIKRTLYIELHQPKEHLDAVWDRDREAGLLDILVTEYQKTSGFEQRFKSLQAKLRTGASEWMEPSELDRYRNTDSMLEAVLNHFRTTQGNARSKLEQSQINAEQLQEDCYLLRAESKKLGESISRLTQENRDYQKAAVELKRSHVEQMKEVEEQCQGRLKSQKTNADKELQDRDRRYVKEVSDLKGQFSVSLKQQEDSSRTVQSQLKTQNQRLWQQNETDKLERETRHIQDISNLKEEHQKLLAKQASMSLSVQTELRNENKKLSEQNHIDMRKRDSDAEELRRLCEEKIRDAEKNCTSLIDSQRKTHFAELRDMKTHYEEEIERLKGKLQQREHVKGLTDRQIADTFKKLARDIDSFSRVAWDRKKQANWPLSESVLSRARNDRKLKQFLVQTDIWVTLNETIFQTPFAIFLDEGSSLHADWMRDCGAGKRSILLCFKGKEKIRLYCAASNDVFRTRTKCMGGAQRRIRDLALVHIQRM